MRRLSAAISLTAVAVSCLSSYSFAENSQIQFHIPAQDMRSALIEFADATDLSLIYDIGDLGNMESHSVSGSYYPLEALRIILGDSGFTFKKTGKESIAIRKDRQTPAKMKEKTRDSTQTIEQPKVITKVERSKLTKKEKNVPDGAYMIDEITATGSRISGVEEGVGTSVIGLEREDINISASYNVDTVIKELPSVMNLGISETTRAQEGGKENMFASNAVNIHGIGTYSTLALLEGHRIINNGRYTDASVVPTLGVERIEVVADGASAVYGSDAIAGVVNVIPRRTLDGIEASLRYGTADGFYQYRAGSAAGRMWDSGQFMIAYERSSREQLDARDRPFYTADQRPYGGPDYRTTMSSPGTIIVGDTTYAIPEGGVTPETADLLVSGTVNLDEPYKGKSMFPEQNRNTANLTFNQVVNDIEFFADGFYSKREFVSNSGFSRVRLTVPSTNAFFVQPTGLTVDSYEVDFNFSDLPGMTVGAEEGMVENWEMTPGFRYDLPYGFKFEAFFTYGKSKNLRETYGRIRDREAIDAAAASSDPATALDVYGLGRTTAETIEAITHGFRRTRLENDFQGYEASVTGPVLDLPGGFVKLAAGYEGQRYVLNSGDQFWPDDPEFPWLPELKRDVDSLYLEVYVPFLSSKNATTGIHRLELTAAIRYDEYSDIGESTTNPKIGFNYSPIETIMFRGSYGTSFRAPLMENIGTNTGSLLSGLQIYQQRYQDPAGGPPIIGYALYGTNPDLTYEEATTWGLGVRFTPTQDTEFNLDFFNVEYKDKIISRLSDLTILSMEDEYAGMGVILHGAEAAAEALRYEALGAYVALGDWPEGGPGNVSLWVDGRPMNLGSSTTQGIDFSASQNLRTHTAGSFRFTVDATLMTKHEVAYTPGSKQIDMLNIINEPIRFKARGSVDWNYSFFISQVSFRYVNSYDNIAVTPIQKVDSWMPVDLIVGFNGDDVGWLGSWGTGLSVTLEGRNIFDLDPPYVNYAPNFSGGGGWDPAAADPTGRLLAISLRKDF